MFVVLKSISLPDQDERAVASLIATLEKFVCEVSTIHSHLLQPALPNGVNDGQILWRLCFATFEDYQACMLSSGWRGTVEPTLSPAKVRVDSVAYEQGRHAAPHPHLKNGIYRALIVSVVEGTDRATLDRFEAEMRAMPDYVATIRNWSLSRVLISGGARRWSYVWEQDFADIEGLTDEYMMHPIHWGSIDRWYDIEHPDHILDGYLIHTVCRSPVAVIVPQRRN